MIGVCFPPANQVQNANASLGWHPATRSDRTQPIVEAEMAKTHRICSISNCGNKVIARGWCDSHYRRWQLHGDPLKGRIPNGEAARFLNEVVIPFRGNDCLIWPYAKNPSGYGAIGVHGRKREVHRLACIAANGEPPTPKHQAAHNCGNGHLGCCNPKHLRWDTIKGNFADKKKHGTYTRGEDHPVAKLTQVEVLEIRSLAETMSQSEIAAKFGVANSTVGAIISRENWGWLP